MDSPVLDYRSPPQPGEESAIPPAPMLAWSRVACALGAIALPLFCIVVAANGGYLHAPEYQSTPVWQAYVQMVPVPEVGWPFYPLMGYAMLCAGAMVAAPRVAPRSFVVRFGLLSGIIIAVQFGVIYVLGSGVQPMAMFLAGGIVGLLIASALLRLIPPHYRTPVALLVLTLPLAVLVSWFGLRRVMAFYFWLLVAAPAVTAFSYLTLLEVAMRSPARVAPSGRTRVVLPLAWLAGWAAAWKGSMMLAAAKYATLPPTQPSCYVATAAARGHPWFVGAAVAYTRDGEPYRVNAQLRRLKRFEILLALVAHRWHRWVRWVYDAVGPRLARRLAHPLAADVAYLLLKPAEWTLGRVASLVLPVDVYPDRVKPPTVSAVSVSPADRR
jgi:hypothetical protein